MSLTNQDLSDLAKEFSVVKAAQADNKAAIPATQKQVKEKQEQVRRSYIPYNNVHVNRITPYETEHRWLDGTTYTTITTSQIETFGTNGKSTHFFPESWTLSNAKLSDNANGNPKTTSSNSELSVLTESLDNQGLIATISLLRNGQSSAKGANTLDANYTPGAATITVTTSGHTNGKLLCISGSGTSALVRITNVSGTTLTITELIPPASTISTGGSVVENILGFTNSERNTLTSGSYQRILTELTNRIITKAGLWNTALSNQLTQLNANIDAAAQVSTAKSGINTAQTAYNTWSALSSTGASGKFVDTSLNNLATAYNTRTSFIPTRTGQITTALGSVAQDGSGNYTGAGHYLQRFKCLNFIINSTDGALFQANSIKMLQTDQEKKVTNGSEKMATYGNLVRYGSFAGDATGSTVKIDGANQFAASDTVLLTANDLPGLPCTVASVSGQNITLSIAIPKEYSKSSKAGIIKQI